MNLLSPQTAKDAFEEPRLEMVRTQLQMRGIKKAEVLAAMRRVPRERFVPESARSFAYEDRAFGIGYRATISQPYIVALMTELLDVKPWHKVLEIGTGSGYQAAVLNELAKEVYSIEIVPELAEKAKSALREMGFGKVTVRAGDGYLGWPEQAPFERIIITAAPPRIPQTLVDQLAPGGRLVAPEGESPEAQQLVILDKDSRGRMTRTVSIPVVFVPMVPQVPDTRN
ncbi:MAG: protein-L-isoaspartate(D-aspartate) O-methyltransferase [Bryobacterales bacterium]|nr:protein-L-isoaspartate(D-aspartate) O-methyltransferase [Bryobacterales bacterium]